MSEPSDLDLEHIKAKLLARKAELEQLDESSADARKPVELDQTRTGRLSRMDALQGQAMAQATHRRREQELQRIEAALKRIDAGEFGECVHCGEAIAAKRLEFDPTTPLCIDCARQD
ncbi:MAG: TraR/DksA family transcriptional regulator [Rhodovibrionaceae bacterium]|nr:TraR/DksA family transcriptional regulator [Rhodovibrionaceae bacterium]